MKERNHAKLQWTILEERDDFAHFAGKVLITDSALRNFERFIKRQYHAFQLFAAVDFNDCA